MSRILNAAILALGLAGVALPASAQSAMPTSPSPAGITESDRQFMIQDATGGFYEIAIAALAQERSSRDDIKSYAAMLIRDHAEYNTALQQLATSKGVTLPTGMTADDRTKLNGMNLQGGSTLDRSFILEAIRINDEDRKAAQNEAAATSDPDIRAFLQKFAAMDAKHEQGAKALQR
jgi:putative membrane protein